LQDQVEEAEMTGDQPQEGRIQGSLGSADGKGVVRVEGRLDADIDAVWTALTVPASLGRWLGEIEGGLNIGGEFRARFYASGWEGTGQVQACEPPRRLTVLTTDEEDPDDHFIEVALTEEGSQTILVWEERGMPVDQAAAYGATVQIHVEDLVSHLAGGERCDAALRWKELIPTYQGLAHRSE
jgi:uncharacterized protein YndB with AHSA1/START domain